MVQCLVKKLTAAVYLTRGANRLLQKTVPFNVRLYVKGVGFCSDFIRASNSERKGFQINHADRYCGLACSDTIAYENQVPPL